MGYDTYITGELVFSAPITAEALESIAGGTDLLDYACPATGELISGLEFEGSMRWYEAENDLIAFCEAMSSIGVNVTGEVTGDGEDTDDYWRVVADKGSAIYEQRSAYWPSEIAPLLEAVQSGDSEAFSALLNYLKEA